MNYFVNTTQHRHDDVTVISRRTLYYHFYGLCPRVLMNIYSTPLICYSSPPHSIPFTVFSVSISTPFIPSLISFLLEYYLLNAHVRTPTHVQSGPDAFCGTLSDVIMRLVVDEDPLVRLRVLKKLPLIAKEIPNLCTVLTVHMRKMFVDTNWRIRKELALAMPEILRSMGQDHFCEQFLDHFLSLLNDDVGEVRLACAESLPKLATASNATWVHEILFPAVRELATGRCLVRLSMISALQGLIEAEISEKFQCEILSLVISASKDQVRNILLHLVILRICSSCNKQNVLDLSVNLYSLYVRNSMYVQVPNIRIRAAQALGVASKHIGVELGRAHVRPVLTALLADKDRDVQYFATESLKFCA